MSRLKIWNPNTSQWEYASYGGDGPTGPTGPTGSYGGPVSFEYIFNTGTTNADPGSGQVSLNNTIQNAATAIYIDTTDHSGNDLTALLDTLDISTSSIKGEFRFTKKSDPAQYITFNMSSRTAHTGYREYAITAISSSSGAPFAGGDELVTTFSQVGDAGSEGATGPVWNANALTGVNINAPSAALTTVTATTLASSATMTSSGAFATPTSGAPGVAVGMAVTGPGILPQTYVKAIASTSSLTLSQAASSSAETAPGTGTVKFYAPWWPLNSTGTWRSSTNSPRVVAFFGDSITQGYGISGTDPFVTRIARLLGQQIGPLISPGLRGVWMLAGEGPWPTAEWVITTANDWIPMTGTGAADVAPFGFAFYNNQSGNGVAQGLVWTKPAWMTSSILSFEILYIDSTTDGLNPSGSHATTDWCYVIDGGSKVDSGAQTAGSNTLKRLQVNSAITSTLDIRPGTASGTVGTAAIVGIIPYYVSSGWAHSGLVVHNVGVASSGLITQTTIFYTLYPFYRPSSTGDPMQIIDVLQPDLCICEWINDQDLGTNTTANWTIAQQALFARAGSIYTSSGATKNPSNLLWMNYYSAPVTSNAFQQTFRNTTKTNTAKWGVSLVDLYDEWAAAGFYASGSVSSNAASTPLFNLPTDKIHPNQAGHNNIALSIIRALLM